MTEEIHYRQIYRESLGCYDYYAVHTVHNSNSGRMVGIITTRIVDSARLKLVDYPLCDRLPAGAKLYLTICAKARSRRLVGRRFGVLHQRAEFCTEFCTEFRTALCVTPVGR